MAYNLLVDGMVLWSGDRIHIDTTTGNAGMTEQVVCSLA
jgi:hypothetical protein